MAHKSFFIFVSTMALVLSCKNTDVINKRDSSPSTRAADAINEPEPNSDEDLPDGPSPVRPINLTDGNFIAVKEKRSPRISWETTVVEGVEVTDFELTLGTSKGASDILPWTPVGNVRNYEFQNITLVSGQTYFASIRAKDNRGAYSSVVHGDGFLVSETPFLCLETNNPTDCAKTTKFITSWNTADSAVAQEESIPVGSIRIPIDRDLISGYDFFVDWGDNTVERLNNLTSIDDPKLIHQYATAGSYDIKIFGKFPAIRFPGNNFSPSIAYLLTDLKQWGAIEWQSMANAFSATINFNGSPEPIEAPDLSSVTNMSNMFNDAINFNGYVNNWDTSNVVTLSEIFEDADRFKEPVDGWNTANVTDLSYAFWGANDFNQAVSTWDTSKVTTMARMFEAASAFNQPINNWNTSSVTDMSRVFRGAASRYV